MLIICSGPDTWRARQKARELVQAFKDKHDQTGFSTEIVNGRDLGSVLNQIGTPSIFNPKRMIRFDGLLDGIKQADLKTLVKRLKEDGENNVILTVEDEPPALKVLDDSKDIKVVVYAYPPLDERRFAEWCREKAKEFGVGQEAAAQIADRTHGDSWMAINELQKFGANKDAPWAELDYESGTVYEAVDALFAKSKGWREDLHAQADEQVASIVLNQSKNALKAKSGTPLRIPYQAVRRMQKYPENEVAKVFFSGLAALVGSRTGLLTQSEADVLL